MHILMVPSWYPETDTDFNGSFFREQAGALVAAGHTVGVLAARVFPVYQQSARRSRDVQPVSVEADVRVLRSDVVAPFPKLHRLNQQVIDRTVLAMYDQYVSLAGAPDVLHAHSMFYGGVSAARLSAKRGVPYVITEHRPSSIKRLQEIGNRRMGRAAANGAGGLVAVAREFATDLNEAYGAVDPNWRYVPGLLSPQFEHISVRPAPAGPFTIGHVSHLDRGKRVDLLIKAFAEVFRSNQGVRLRIAGGSEGSINELRTVATGAGVETQVDFVGSVPREGIVAEFAHSHVFALTSEAEAFGTVLWEAMAEGIPILATDTWAGRNAVTTQVGELVTRDSLTSVAAGLRRIHERFDAFDSEQIRQLSLGHCGEAAFVSQYEDVYRRAIA